MPFHSNQDNLFVCPVCKNPLIREGNSLLCRNRHTFDVAGSGYVNLLRSSRSAHGDNRDMVAARRAFLEKGYYAPLKHALAKAVTDCLPSGGILLDSGCGEGYYTEAFTQNSALRVFGIDVSSRAAALAAKKKDICGVAVASAYDLPVADGSCHAVTNIFAPFCREEFFRILTEGGLLFNVIPAERHLFELKSAIYETPYENKLRPIETEGFAFLKKIPVETTFRLDSQEDIGNLLLMTPYFYRTNRQGHARAQALTSIEVTASFYILIYRKESPPPTDPPA